MCRAQAKPRDFPATFQILPQQVELAQGQKHKDKQQDAVCEDGKKATLLLRKGTQNFSTKLDNWSPFKIAQEIYASS